MSRPSKPKSLIKETAEEANWARPAGVDAGAAKLAEYVQPPEMFVLIKLTVR